MIFLLLHNKVGRYTLSVCVERLLYASGAGWQGRVNCEFQHSITPSLRWHPLFFFSPRHRHDCELPVGGVCSGAPDMCGASSDKTHVLNGLCKHCYSMFAVFHLTGCDTGIFTSIWAVDNRYLIPIVHFVFRPCRGARFMCGGVHPSFLG